MISLLLETSTELGFVALFKDKQLIYHENLPVGLQNSKNLFSEIVKAFSILNLSPKDLGLVIAGIGPGSYTGIRVSAITAKTLSFALGIPLIGVCTLDGFIPQKEGVFTSMIDARIGGVYLQTGIIKNNSCSWMTDPLLYSLEKAADCLKEISTIVTPSALLLRPKFAKFFDENHLEWIESAPNVSEMGRSAFDKFEKGEYSTTQELKLLYLRKTQAEIERESFFRNTGF